MDLMDPTVRWVAAALVVVGLGGGAVATSFGFRRRWLTVVKNLVVLAVACSLVFLGAGLELNRRNAWYPTLDQALGVDDQQAAGPVADVGAKDAGETFGRGREVPGQEARALPPLPSPGSRAQVFTVPSHGRPWRVDVWLPEGYFDAANAHRSYPVVMMTHGVPGSNAVWQSRMSLAKYADPVIAAHRVAPFIAVMPETTPGGLDTECIVGPDADDQMETWLSVDVPAFVKSHLRAATRREAWAVAGYSAGGWCAAMLPVLHPDVFGAGVSLSGYFQPWFGTHRPHWQPGSAQDRRHDLVRAVGKDRPRVALYVLGAHDDQEFWPTARPFLAQVRAPTLVAAQVQQSGGHSWSLWLPGLGSGLAWLGQQVPGFRP